MSYCLNPTCPRRDDPANAYNRVCQHCGSELLLQGRYRVIRLISEDSGFGDVYETDDQGTTKILKVLKPHLNRQEKTVELFRQEAEVLSHLHHPGIPKVDKDGYFVFTPRNGQVSLHCLIMEKIDGLNLEQWMDSRGNQPISQKRAIAWLQQITKILAQIHSQDYFHRDIKPSNIMLRSSSEFSPNRDQLVLIDFGAAREVTGTYLAKMASGNNVTGVVSPGYTPLEQVNGKAVPQSDFFALGRTLIYLLTGMSPTEFSEDFQTGKLMWRSHAPQITQSLANLIDNLIETFPGRRPSSAEVILQRLEEIQQPTSSFVQTPSRSASPPPPVLPQYSHDPFEVQPSPPAPPTAVQPTQVVAKAPAADVVPPAQSLLMRYNYAGFWKRLKATAIDGIALTAIIIIGFAALRQQPSVAPFFPQTSIELNVIEWRNFVCSTWDCPPVIQEFITLDTIRYEDFADVALGSAIALMIFGQIGVSAFILAGLVILIGLTPVPSNAVLPLAGILLSSALLHWLYFTVLESSGLRATLGKIAMGVLVVDVQGNRISWKRANLRYWYKIVSTIVGLVGYLLAAVTSQKRALHDMMAGTYVVSPRTESNLLGWFVLWGVILLLGVGIYFFL